MDGRRLAQLREAKGLTQWELAKRTDLTIRTISHIENNRRGMRAQTAQRIARALEISTDELLGEPEGVAS